MTRGLSFAVLLASVCCLTPETVAGEPAACPTDAFFETFEQGGNGWTHSDLDGWGPQYDSWHLGTTTVPWVPDLGSTMYVSYGNANPAWAVERSKLLSPQIALPPTAILHLIFDAVSYDEGGACLAAPDWDRKDVGVTLDGGASWQVLNFCWAITPYAAEGSGTGTPVTRQLDLSSFAGQSVKLVFAYDTVDADIGHTFAVDNVRIVRDDHDLDTVGGLCDCEPFDASAWSIPTDVEQLVLVHDPPGSSGTTTLSWAVPQSGGTVAGMRYDVIRSTDPAEFVVGAECVHSDLVATTSADDVDQPNRGEVFYYRVRPGNACDEGVAGRDSNDAPQPAVSCP